MAQLAVCKPDQFQHARACQHACFDWPAKFGWLRTTLRPAVHLRDHRRHHSRHDLRLLLLMRNNDDDYDPAHVLYVMRMA